MELAYQGVWGKVTNNNNPTRYVTINIGGTWR